MKRIGIELASVAFAFAVGMTGASAQGTTGTPGSPGATTTIPSTQLPPPDPNSAA